MTSRSSDPVSRGLAAAAVVAAAGLGLAACSGGGGAGAPQTPAPAGSSPATGTEAPTPSGGGPIPGSAAQSAVTITIHDFTYRVPNPVSPGKKIMVHNTDDVAHTVTADQDKSLFDLTVNPGKTGSFTAPSTPGSYAFSCNFHGNMHGTLIVQ